MTDTSTLNDKNVKGDEARRNGYWKHILGHYEKRNASLERRHAALMERVRFMECALPSLLMGAVVNSKFSSENCQSCSSRSEPNCEQSSITKNVSINEEKKINEITGKNKFELNSNPGNTEMIRMQLPHWYSQDKPFLVITWACQVAPAVVS